MNYGNVLQQEGYFQINTSIKELLTAKPFKLNLSGQYLLELVDVSVDSQFYSSPNTSLLCLIFNLQSPQFSSTLSGTPGINFSPNLIVVNHTATHCSLKYTGAVRPRPNKIIASLSGSILLDLQIYFIDNVSGADAVYAPLSTVFQNGGTVDNMIFSFGFRYSKVN